jgi:hypothetical protein
MRTNRQVVALAVLLVAVHEVRGQTAPPNMLVDGAGPGAWEPHHDAKAEHFRGEGCLAVRSPGSFSQMVALSAAAAGTYAVLAGLGQSDRINTDGSITGMPYLYATVWTGDTKRVLAYWQGANSLMKSQVAPAMLARPESPTDWVKMYGLFEVPKSAALIRVQLSQGERRGSPPDGSVARFRDVRLHLFPTERAARTFVNRYIQE